MSTLLTDSSEQGGKLLRRKAKRVKNVQSTEVILGIQDMKRAAHVWEAETGKRCEGLAASQIGWNVRVIILRATDEMKSVAPKPDDFVFDDAHYRFDERGYREALSAHREWNRVHGGTFDPWVVLINPTILQVEGSQTSEEGCLSVPGTVYRTTRPTHVGFRFTRPNRTYSGVHLARGDSAVKLMHEIDHLNGVLLPDIAQEPDFSARPSEGL
jgi:peptide deformylase